MLPEVAELFACASGCRACPGMGCPPVLSAANGPAAARVMFVGEAPGRFGAARTGIPFEGDASGHRFARLLAASGLSRHEVFITNAVLCLPTDSFGRNRTPGASEIRNCSNWLAATIETIDPELVVAMGRTALARLARIEPHARTLRDSGQAPCCWNRRFLAVVYHPGARSQVHRGWQKQLSDWRRLGKAIA